MAVLPEDGPQTPNEIYLAKIAGEEVELPPEGPQTRNEQYLAYIAENGGGGGGASSWNQITGKPFKTIGTGLRVVGDAITYDPNEIASADDIDAIDAKIPPQASSENQLADKDFVNSSIGTNTAYYISDNGQPFASLAALEAYAGEITNNDYAFVVGTDSAGNTTYTRYKYNAEEEAWAEEYVLNNSSFTAAQWAAINSNATAEAIAKALASVQVDDISHETWTFTLEDDTEVTKEVVLWIS